VLSARRHNPVWHLTKKAILPAIHITSVAELDDVDESASNLGNRNAIRNRTVAYYG
jgi:hypothetical protein